MGVRGRVRAGEIRNKPDNKVCLEDRDILSSHFCPYFSMPSMPQDLCVCGLISRLQRRRSHHKNGHDTSLLALGKVPGKKGNILKSTV